MTAPCKNNNNTKIIQKETGKIIKYLIIFYLFKLSFLHMLHNLFAFEIKNYII